MKGFSDAWNTRSSLEPNVRGDARKYLSSSERDYYLIIRIEEILPHIREVNEFLRVREELSTLPENFLHLTVKTFGPRKPDTEIIRKVLSDQESFVAKFGNLNLIPEGLILECRSTEIRSINRRLSENFGAPRVDKDSFHPHITLAYFRTADIGDFIDYLQVRRQLNIPSFPVKELELVRDNTDHSFQTVESFSL